MIKLFITVEGGCVSGVFADRDDIDLVIVDHDEVFDDWESEERQKRIVDSIPIVARFQLF